MSWRDNIVFLAESYEGCGASDPDRYLGLLGPNENEAVRRAMLSQSGCALTVRGFMRRLGVVHPRLSNPYVIGKAVEDVIAIAKDKGAWVDARCGFPSPGDFVFVGSGGHEHFWTMVREDGEDVEGIDGGQLTGGLQVIKRIPRKMKRLGGVLWDLAKTSRIVNGWADGDALFA